MVKDALAQVGFPVGTCRLPLVPPTPEQSAELGRVLAHLGLV
jgi:dihydrodipicolinate synthase/N-acetylneuraminate lyase